MIARFTLVQLVASQEGRPSVMAWSPLAYEEPALSTSHLVLGVTMTAATTYDEVAVMRSGYLRDVARQNGETWAVGDILYGKADGTITKTRPAGPLPQVIVGTVFETIGVLHTVDVDVRVLPSIAELSGVTRETLVNLDALIYNSTTHAWVPRQIDHGADLAGLTDDDHPLYQRKHGFEVAASGAALVTISYDKATKKITITPVATFRFWIDGIQFIKTGAQVSGAHGAGTGLYYFYYDAAGTLQVSAVNTPWSLRDRTITPVAVVYWSNTLADGVCFYEAHTADRVLELHYNLHFSRGCQFISGLDLGNYVALTDTDAAVTYSIGAGVIADEDIRFAVGATADTGPYVIFWRTGATGEWTWTVTDSFPFKNGGTYPQRNDPNGGGAGVWGLTEVGDAVGRYVNDFICATSAVTPAAASAFLIPGQLNHASLAAAQAEGIQSLSLGTLPFEEVAPVWKVTLFCRSVLGGTYNCRIEQVTSLKNQTVTIATSSTGLVWADLVSDQAIIANRVFGG